MSGSESWYLSREGETSDRRLGLGELLLLTISPFVAFVIVLHGRVSSAGTGGPGREGSNIIIRPTDWQPRKTL